MRPKADCGDSQPTDEGIFAREDVGAPDERGCGAAAVALPGPGSPRATDGSAPAIVTVVGALARRGGGGAPPLRGRAPDDATAELEPPFVSAAARDVGARGAAPSSVEPASAAALGASSPVSRRSRSRRRSSKNMGADRRRAAVGSVGAPPASSPSTSPLRLSPRGTSATSSMPRAKASSRATSSGRLPSDTASCGAAHPPPVVAAGGGTSDDDAVEGVARTTSCESNCEDTGAYPAAAAADNVAAAAGGSMAAQNRCSASAPSARSPVTARRADDESDSPLRTDERIAATESFSPMRVLTLASGSRRTRGASGGLSPLCALVLIGTSAGTQQSGRGADAALSAASTAGPRPKADDTGAREGEMAERPLSPPPVAVGRTRKLLDLRSCWVSPPVTSSPARSDGGAPDEPIRATDTDAGEPTVELVRLRVWPSHSWMLEVTPASRCLRPLRPMLELEPIRAVWPRSCGIDGGLR